MAFLGGLALLGETREAGLSMAEKRARIQQAQAQQEASLAMPDMANAIAGVPGVPGIGQQPGQQQPPVAGLSPLGQNGTAVAPPPPQQAPQDVPQQQPVPQQPAPAPPTSGAPGPAGAFPQPPAGGFGWGGPAPQQQPPVQFGYAGQPQQPPALAALQRVAMGGQPQGGDDASGSMYFNRSLTPAQRVGAAPSPQDPAVQPRQQVVAQQGQYGPGVPQRQPAVPMPQRPGITTAPELANWIHQNHPGISQGAFNGLMKQGLEMIKQQDQQYWLQLQHHDEEVRQIDAQKQREIQNREAKTRQELLQEQRKEAEQRAQETLELRRQALKDKEEKAAQDKADIEATVRGMKRGTIPPNVTGYRGNKAALEAEATRQDVDLTKLTLQYGKAQQMIRGLSSQRMQQFFGSVESVQKTMDELRRATNALDQGGFTKWNELRRDTMKQFDPKTGEGKLVAQYLAAVAGVETEVSNVIAGGYAPHEAAFELARDLINKNYSAGEMNAALDEVHKILQYRVNAIVGLTGGMATEPNPYLPGATVPGMEGGGRPQPGAPPVDYKTYFGGQ